MISMETNTSVNIVKINACKIGSNTSKNRLKGSGMTACRSGIGRCRAWDPVSSAVKIRAITMAPPRILPKSRKPREIGKDSSSMIFRGNIKG